MAAVPDSRTWTIKLPPGTKLLTANMLTAHWSKNHATIRNLRRMADQLARNQRIPVLVKVKIRATYHPPDNRRRDSTQNYFPSIKAAIDGLVDARILTDDNDKVVMSLEMVRGENVKGGQLVLEIIDAGPGA
jgi:Holliday junction resolvase RusA-like endonuclease